MKLLQQPCFLIPAGGGKWLMRVNGQDLGTFSSLSIAMDIARPRFRKILVCMEITVMSDVPGTLPEIYNN